jgi:hypothetical protein
MVQARQGTALAQTDGGAINSVVGCACFSAQKVICTKKIGAKFKITALQLSSVSASKPAAGMHYGRANQSQLKSESSSSDGSTVREVDLQ